MTFKVKDGISIAGTTFVDGSRNITAGNITAGTVTAALSGNATTATTLAAARTINGVSFNGSANINVPSLYDANYRRITNPGGAEYVTSTPSVTGAIAIVLPVGMTGAMLRLSVKIYEYTTNESFEVICGGYNYATGNTWANSPFAYIVGNPSIDRRFTVRFGFDGTNSKAIIYIGELASTWSYPQVFVTEVQTGFSGQASTWTSGWSIAFEASAFQNVTATVTNSQVGYAVSTNTANSTVLRDGSGNFSAGTITATLSGNASTVTNGVYTTGSYADPAWITSLAKSKVGLGSVENTALSTWAGSTNITTLGSVSTTGINSTGALTTNIGGGATSSTKHIALTNGTNYDLFLLPRAGSGSYNPSVQAGDAVIGFSAGAVDTGALNIVPWSNSSIGIRVANTGTTINGNLSITGNLTINGTTTTVNSTTVTVDDPIFTLGGDTAPTVDDNKDRGIEFRWHNGTTSKIGFFGFDDSTGYLTFIPDATNTSEVFSGTQGDIQATNFRGALVGNASTATTATNLSGGTVGATTGTFSSTLTSSFAPAAINTTTPGLTNYGFIFNGASSTDNAQGITWTWATSGAAQAGIYVQSSGNYGTKMYIATTDSFATGSRTAISIDHTGLTNFVRARPTALGNTILDAGNYNSYSPTLTGGGASGTWGISVTGNAATVSSITSTQVTTALGYTPYNSTNPNSYASNQSSIILIAPTGAGAREFAVATTGDSGVAVGRTGPSYTNAGVTWMGGDRNYIYYSSASPLRIGSSAGYVEFNGSTLNAGGNTVLHAGNYNSYSPTLTGTGASGTWGVSITGNAATATTLQTARTINGVSFNGSANITITANTPNTLTMGVSGTGLSGSATFNGSAATTFTVTSNATSANTASTIVARDASGNFVAGRVTASSGIISGDTLGYANYDFLLDFGADVANTWRKLVTVSSPTGQYQTIGFKIDVVDPKANHATTGAQDSVVTETYYVNCVRTNDVTQDTPDACYVRGPGNRIRAVKTSIGNYEIQIQNEAQYREYRGTISVYAVNGSHTVSYHNGATALTGTAQYAASVSTTSTNIFQNVATRQLTLSVPTGTAPMVVTSTTRVSNLNVATAGTADTWTTARTITLGGDLTGSVSINGSADVTLSAQVVDDSHNHTNYMLRSASSQTDPNTNFNSSAYRFDPNANNPTNEHYAIITYGNQSNVTGQLATHFTSGQTFTRAYNSSWSAWRTQLDSSNYNSYSPTLTGGGASGTWSINVTGSAAALGGYTADLQTTTAAGDYLLVRDQANTRIKLATAASVASIVQGGASGTWSISVTGSAGSASTATNSTQLGGIAAANHIYGSNGSGSNGLSATENVYELGQYKSGFWDINGASWTPGTGWWWGATFAHRSNTSSYNYSGQLAFSINGGGNNVYARTIDGGAPTAWARLLSSGNYNSYSPTLTGGGASGTWAINISGNAATATSATDNTKLPLTGGTLTGSRTVELNTSNGAITFKGDSGGWSMGTYFKGSDNILKAGFGALGGGSSFTNLWAGAEYNSAWMTWTSSATNSLVALQQSGNQVLHAGNYTSYSPSLTGTGASGSWGISVTGSAGSVAWTNVSGKPTAVSSFTNDSGYIVSSSPALINGASQISGSNSALCVQYAGAGTQYGITIRPLADSTTVMNIMNAAGSSVGSISQTSTGITFNGAIAWTNVSGRPTAVSSFTNDSGYITGSSLTSYLALTGGTMTGVLSINRSDPQRLIQSNNTSASNAAQYFVEHNLANVYMGNLRGAVNIYTNGSNAATFDISGNLTMVANVTAYSDERLKKDWRDLSNDFVARLASVKVGTYSRIDQEMRQVGVSAQSLQEILPESVLNDGQYLSVAYGNAALASAVELAKECVDLRKQLSELKDLVRSLLTKE